MAEIVFRRHLSWGVALLVAFGLYGGQDLQARPMQETPYTLHVVADEVDLTFHAADFHGMPMEDLTLADLRLIDNGKRPRQIVSFAVERDLPIRAGVLFDTSRSMLDELPLNRQIAKRYATHLLRTQTDRAFVMRFDSEAKVKQDWTNDVSALTASLKAVADDHASRLGGTAVFDAIFRACRDQWTDDRNAVTGNFLLLFSDGVDNTSHARMEDVIDMCQQRRVAIYVFSSEAKSMFVEGQKTLKELVSQSGGRIFFDQKEAQMWDDLRLMEGDQRSQYRLVYKPVHRKGDRSFHRIQLSSPTRGGVITTRSGYYATE